MIKKRIKYVDFNGVDREEDFYFHLSEIEATRLAAKWAPESPEEYITRIAKDGDMQSVLATIEMFILDSYGQKSKDGRSFLKDPTETKAFEYSQAYAELFGELLTNHEELQKFARGIGATVKSNPKQIKFPVEP